MQIFLMHNPLSSSLTLRRHCPSGDPSNASLNKTNVKLAINNTSYCCIYIFVIRMMTCVRCQVFYFIHDINPRLYLSIALVHSLLWASVGLIDLVVPNLSYILPVVVVYFE